MAKIFAYTTARNQPKTNNIILPVVEGLRRHGHTVEVRESDEYSRGDEEEADILAVWGDYAGVDRILRDCGKKRWQMLHIDNAYLRRGHYDGYYGVSWNARQCEAYLWGTPFPADRFQKLNHEIKPWKTGGSTIAVLGFSRKQGQVIGLGYLEWLAETVKEVRRHTKRKVVARPKLYDGSDVRAFYREQDVFAVVGLFTKSMVMALLDGIPVFPLAPCAASSMGIVDLKKIDTPWYPDNREDFFNRLAFHQWTLKELERGEPWDHIWQGS